MRNIVSRFFGQDEEDEPQEESAKPVSDNETLMDTGIAKDVHDQEKIEDVRDGLSVESRELSANQNLSEERFLEATEDFETESAAIKPPGDDEIDSLDINPSIEDTQISQANDIEETSVSTKPIILDQPPRPSAFLQASQCCHIGNIRNRNEDSTFIFTAEAGGEEPLLPFGLYIVADGMGGHHAGHEASRIVSRLLAQEVLERIYLPLLKRSTETPTRSQEPIQDVILEAIQYANRHIHNPDPGKDSGTTLTSALVFGRRLYVTQVGDSRAYLYSNQQLKQITIDHSYVQRLIDAGELTEEEAAIHPQRNMLYKAVGQGGMLDIDTYTQTLPKTGIVVLCSDGLWGLVSDNEITEILRQNKSLSQRAEDLVSAAQDAGGHDNISAILIAFEF